MTVIDLDALTNPKRLPVVKLFGRKITVKPLTGSSAHRIAALQDDDSGGASMLAALLDVIHASCPDLSESELAALTVDQIAALVQLARGQITEVETMLQERSEKN